MTTRVPLISTITVTHTTCEKPGQTLGMGVPHSPEHTLL